MSDKNVTVALVSIIVLAGLAGCSKKSPTSPPPAGEESSAAEGAVAQGLSAPQAQTDAIDAEHLADARRLINGGITFLLANREADGGWSLGGGANKPAITAMVLKALLQHPDFDAGSEVVKRGFDVLSSFGRKDGGIYDPRIGLANYTTALAIMAMVAAEDPQFNGAIRRAVAFMKGRQIVPGSESPDGEFFSERISEPISEKHPFFGGVSYGKHGRPDLSNVGMWMQALRDAGVSGDDPGMKRALVFLTRVQNRSESNSQPWAAAGVSDGGFVYAPAVRGDLAAGESKAGTVAGGRGLRSYGSMTYVGFKSMLYANVARDDPRVQAAYQWIRRYWRLDSNPNMPRGQAQHGLYYYYHVFAKALRAWGEPVITDTAGVAHNWRGELIEALRRRVGRDGSWVNAGASRWGEGNAILVTAYSVLALQEALKK